MKTMKKRFYTIIELIVLLGFIVMGLLAVSAIGGLVYVAIHFLKKVW